MSLEDTLRVIVREELRSVVADFLAKQTPPPPTGTQYLTLKEAAAYARVSKGTVREWIRRGQLRRYGDSPRTLVVSRAELDRVLAPKPPSGAPSEAELDERVEQLVSRRR